MSISVSVQTDIMKTEPGAFPRGMKRFIPLPKIVALYTSNWDRTASVTTGYI